jgi:hypothetical protein
MVEETDPFGNTTAYQPGEHPDACPGCHQPLSRHVAGKPCVQGKPTVIRGWWHLPMAAGMWAADAKTIER